MRRLVWFTIGYAAACAIGTYLLRSWGILILAAAAVLTAVVLRRYRRSALALLGAAVGCIAFWCNSLNVLAPAAALDEQVLTVRVRASDYSWQTDYGSAVDGTMEIDGKDYKIRFYLSESMELQPGDVIETSAKLRLTDEGGANEPTFHRTNGILLLGYQRGDDLMVTEGEPDWKDYPAVFRAKIKSVIETAFPADTAAFAKALLLGDKTDLSYDIRTDFSVCGLSHIVAVSGLHISILFSMLYTLAGKRRYLTAVVCIPFLLLFGAMTGFVPSVTRAVIMQILMVLALAVNREYDPPTALAFSVLVMLVQNPLVIASVGFQLSVASVAGILLFRKKKKESTGKRKRTWAARLLQGCRSSVRVTLSAMVLTTPMVVYYYHTISLVSVIANLLVLWVINFVFYGIMLSCLGWMLFAPVGTAAAWLVSWLIRYVLNTADLLARLPLDAVYTDSPYVALWLIFAYGLILWCLICRRNGGIAAVLASVGLCVALLLSYAEPLLWDYRVAVLDVGQGQCIVLQSHGNTFMVDCGGDYDQDAADTAARFLLSMGIDRLDGLILTHYDRDHCGGVVDLSRRIRIDTIFLPPTEDTDGILQDILEATADAGQVWVTSDTTITFGTSTIEIFAPEIGDSGNESCAVVLFRGEKCDTLITGDINSFRERQLLGEKDIPDLELLIVGHHGSKYSTSQELLDAAAPDVAIISVGADNSYGHPTQQVLDRLAQAGCVVYRTDLNGTVIFRR